MPTYSENLITRRDAIAAELAAGQTPDGQSFRKPTISVDGETVNTVEYVRSLTEQLKPLNELIASPQAQGSWEHTSIGDT